MLHYIYFYIIVFIIIIGILFTPFIIGENKDKSDKNNIKIHKEDILWSKGLDELSEYQFASTEKLSSKREIINTIKKSKNYIWIRLGTSSESDIYMFEKNMKHIVEEFILVTTDGDRSMPSDIDKDIVDSILSNNKLKGWYTQNYDGTDKRLKPFPIGLDLHTNPNMLNMLKNIRITIPEKIPKIFCDLHLSRENNLKFNNERGRVYDILKHSENVEFLKERISQDNILGKYKEYDFVISTHGNGLDCHRTWEILYLGGIVITKTSSLDELFKDFAVVIVKDWDECLDFDNLALWKEIYSKHTDLKYIDEKFSYKNWLRNI